MILIGIATLIGHEELLRRNGSVYFPSAYGVPAIYREGVKTVAAAIRYRST